MTAAEATSRDVAAMKKITEANPTLGIMLMGVKLVGVLWRACLHLSLGLAIADRLGSLWWGPLLAFVSAQTIGRAWRWWRRDALVHAVEKLAAAETKEASP